MTDKTNEVDVTKHLNMVYHVYHTRFSNTEPSIKDDLISDGMLGLVRASKTFDPEKGYTFATYAYTCIYNTMASYLKHLRADKRKVNYQTTSLSEPLGNLEDLTVADLLVSPDTTSVDVRDTILSYCLHPDIMSLYIDGYNHREIGDMYNVTRANIGKKINNDRERIKNYYLKGLPPHFARNPGTITAREESEQLGVTIRTYFRHKANGTLDKLRAKRSSDEKE